MYNILNVVVSTMYMGGGGFVVHFLGSNTSSYLIIISSDEDVCKSARALKGERGQHFNGCARRMGHSYKGH